MPGDRLAKDERLSELTDEVAVPVTDVVAGRRRERVEAHYPVFSCSSPAAEPGLPSPAAPSRQ
jgi:hypothetical protein